MNAVYVAFQNVFKHYGNIVALDGVDFHVNQGERVALLGPNGSGKSTTVHLAAGLLRPSRGEVRVFGQRPSAQEVRSVTGVMLQIAGIPPTLKVGESIDLFRSYYRYPLSVAETLQLAGLNGLEHRYYGHLSGGQQRRVQFALAICGNPQFLIMDEPTVGLDVEYRRSFWERLHSFAEEKTLLFTTHYLDEADVWAERIIVLHEGRVVADGPVSDVKARVSGKRIRFRSRLPMTTIARIPGIIDAHREGSQFELTAQEPEQVLHQIMSLDRNISDLEIGSAPLEDVFLNLLDSGAADGADQRRRGVGE